MDIQNILDKFAKKLETVSTEDLQAQLLSYPVSNSEMAALDYLDKSNAISVSIDYFEHLLIIETVSKVSIVNQDSSFSSFIEPSLIEEQYQYLQAA